MEKYYEPQYSILSESSRIHGIVHLGPMASFTWNSDPKRLLFVLARYKFAARLLEGAKSVIEIGCGDGFASRIVKQHVERLILTDADPLMTEQAMGTSTSNFPLDVLCHNFCSGSLPNSFGLFDGAYMLDVLEHIPSTDESKFFNNLCVNLADGAKVVVGLPSLQSQQYASEGSRAGHINCKTKETLAEALGKHFQTVTCFGMNDEVVHTGFGPMSHYLVALCTYRDSGQSHVALQNKPKP